MEETPATRMKARHSNMIAYKQALLGSSSRVIVIPTTLPLTELPITLTVPITPTEPNLLGVNSPQSRGVA